MYNNHKIGAIVPAAGVGNRMKNTQKKQYLKISEKEILEWTLIHLLWDALIDEVWVVAPGEDLEEITRKIDKWIEKYAFVQTVHLVKGGESRQESVLNGLSQMGRDFDWVVVHDGVRPFLEKDWLQKNLESMDQVDGIVAAACSVDTLKMIGENGLVTQTLDRSKIWMIQTPQVFTRSILLKAHLKAKQEQFTGTDDASLVERHGGRVKLCASSRFNIKITTPEDLVFGNAIVQYNKSSEVFL